MQCIKCQSSIDDIAVFCQFCGKKQAISPSKKGKPKSRGNGTGSVYKLPNGKWQAAVTLGYKSGTKKRKRITKSGFKTKREALEYLPTLRNELNHTPIKKIKFNTLYDEWSNIHYPTISKSKSTAYRIAYKKCSDMHYMNISDIRVKDIQGAIDNESGSYYPKHDIKVLCNLMFKHAIQNDYAEKNYTEYVRLPPVPKSNREAFNENEINSLWKDYEAGNIFTGYILILIYTGIRFGELQKINKDKVFLDECYMIGGIKTEAGIDREIALHKKILPIVKYFYDNSKKKLMTISEGDFYEQYYDSLKRAKVRRLTPHCCRHTTATALALLGVDPKIIQEILGHSSYKVTADNYVHVPLKDKLDAINRLK